jgi:hypothetical protein
MNKEDAHRRGVSIILAPAAVAAWDRTGRALCKPSDRVLAVRLSYTDAKGKAMSFCITSAYRPLSSATELEHEEFGDALEEAMKFAQPNDIVMVLMDGNGSIGCSSRDSADFDGTVGSRGIKYSNAAGADLLNIFRAYGLCSTTSFRTQHAGQELRRANLRRANAKMGGGRRTRQRRWRRKQMRREAQLCAEKRPAGELTRAQRRARAEEAQEALVRRHDGRYASWTSSFNKKHYQLDYILVQQAMLSRVRGAYTVRHQVQRRVGPSPAAVRRGLGSLPGSGSAEDAAAGDQPGDAEGEGPPRRLHRRRGGGGRRARGQARLAGPRRDLGRRGGEEAYEARSEAARVVRSGGG